MFDLDKVVSNISRFQKIEQKKREQKEKAWWWEFHRQQDEKKTKEINRLVKENRLLKGKE